MAVAPRWGERAFTLVLASGRGQMGPTLAKIAEVIELTHFTRVFPTGIAAH